MSPIEGQEGYEPAASERGQRQAAGRSPSRVIVVMFALAFIGFGARQAFAQSGEVYSPCWSQEECLNLNGNPGSTAVQQDGLGLCANNRCFCQSTQCYDPHRHETACTGNQGKCYSNPPSVPLTVAIGGAARVVDIGDYIAKVYSYGVSIAGILAGVMFVVGGFQYLTAGSSGRVTKAKERIRDALIGLLLVLGAYVILNTINPDVLRLQMPKVPLVKKKLFVACQYFDMQRPCGQPFTLIRVQGVPDTAPIAQQYRVATGGSADAGGTATTQCIGKSCSRVGPGHSDANERCRIPPNTPTSAPAVNASAAASAPACTSGPVAPYQCLPCLAQGADCRGAGPNSDCCGGYCVPGALRASGGEFAAFVASSGYSGTGSSLLTGKCSTGNNGIQCGIDSECVSQHCADTEGTDLGSQCVSGRTGSLCDDDNDCIQPNVCVHREGINACVPPQVYGPCADSQDCPSGSSCGDDGRCDPHITGCNSDADCSGFNARVSGTLHCWTDHDPHVCKLNVAGAVCHNDNDCSDIPDHRGYCYHGGIQSGSGIAGICVMSEAGAGCDPGHDEQCRRTAPGDTAGAAARANAVCRRIQSSDGRAGICTYDGTAGMPCIGANTGGALLFGPSGDAHTTNTCAPGLTCPNNVFRCVETAPNCSGS